MVHVPHIRPARPEDRDDLYHICLKTADSGQDGTHLYQDPELIGHVYAGPYLAYQPQFAFVLEDDLGVSGYVIGALDTRAFDETLEREWWPALRRRYPDPAVPASERSRDEAVIYQMHHPRPADPDITAAYPSHLHIDLLPRAQGGGHGRRLLFTLFEALRQAGSPGVHLGVGGRNINAQAFYRHVGFQDLKPLPDGGALMGWTL
ncbi:GNAT family N-acetyltransferase [Deinococcus deserti]|uniref:GNAT family N-acetyltransferase n=1 Tax=Deinococcus deserti TaxID=310783 RepID=UPI0002D691A2|nr:GNAT family N-acetyltransferase [Deinococcus deserti]